MFHSKTELRKKIESDIVTIKKLRVWNIERLVLSDKKSSDSKVESW